MIDLTPGELQLLRTLLARPVPNREVRTFGARVTGRARRSSDLDLVAVGHAPPPILVIATLRADLEDSDLPFRIDRLEERDLPATWTLGLQKQSLRLRAPGRSDRGVDAGAASRGVDPRPHDRRLSFLAERPTPNPIERSHDHARHQQRPPVRLGPVGPLGAQTAALA